MWLEMNKAKNFNYKALLFFAIVGVVFFLLNYLAPKANDDYIYTFFCKYIQDDLYFDVNHPITNVADIISSQINHYFIMNGRSIIHCFVQLFCGLLGKNCFNVINTFVFLTFIIAILLYCKTSRSNVFFSLTLVVVSVFFLLPGFSDAFLWMTGSINYLWPATAVVIFLILLEKETDKKFRLISILLVLFAFITGWSHEGVSFPLAISLVLYCILEHKKLSRYQFLLVGCFVIGAIICTFAPATMHKVNGIQSSIGDHVSTVLTCIISIFKMQSIYALVFIVLLKKHFVSTWSIKEWIRQNVLLISCIILSIGVLLVSNATYQRATFYLGFFCVLLFLKTVIETPIQPILKKKLSLSFIIVWVVFLIGLFPYSIQNYKEYKRLSVQVENKQDIIKTNSVDIPYLFCAHVRTPLLYTDNLIKEWFGWFRRVYERKNFRVAMGNIHAVFIPELLANTIETDSNAYKTFVKDQRLPYYVLQINKPDVKKVSFLLRKTTKDDIPFYFRPIAKRMARYTLNEVEEPLETYLPLEIHGRTYLFIGRNKAVDNRVVDIKVE